MFLLLVLAAVETTLVVEVDTQKLLEALHLHGVRGLILLLDLVVLAVNTQYLQLMGVVHLLESTLHKEEREVILLTVEMAEVAEVHILLGVEFLLLVEMAEAMVLMEKIKAFMDQAVQPLLMEAGDKDQQRENLVRPLDLFMLVVVVVLRRM